VNRRLSRRSVLKGTAVSAAFASTGGLLTACNRVQQTSAKPSEVLRIGYVCPVSGDSSSFGETDAYLLRKVRTALAQGLTSGRRKYDVEIVDADSQSDAQTAAKVAADLVHRRHIDLMLCTATPETVNPVSDVCEKAGMPCLSTAVPWEAWYFGRGATIDKPFRYTYHFFFGTGEISTANTSLWHDGKVKTNDVVGVMWPDDADGKAVRQSIGPRLKKSGFTIVDPGAYQDGSRDYSAQIKKFLKEEAEIFNSYPWPADFTSFWRQASMSNYRPRIATIGKTCELPSQLQSLGASGIGITTGFWWTPSFPYPSTLIGQTAKQLADDYTRQTGRQWTQMLGNNMALFEVAVHALKNASDPKDRQALAAQLGSTKTTSMIGPVDWTAGPVKNVSTTPLVTGQWRQASLASGFLFEPVIVDTGPFTDIPVEGALQPLV
jgi:branched-chain amino acid transport system substrate-binding protein